MDQRQLDLGECWEWLSWVRATLGDRVRMVRNAKLALLLADSNEKADLVAGIESLIAEIDHYALKADQLGSALTDKDAIQALERVSKKLDRLSTRLTGLIVQHGVRNP